MFLGILDVMHLGQYNLRIENMALSRYKAWNMSWLGQGCQSWPAKIRRLCYVIKHELQSWHDRRWIVKIGIMISQDKNIRWSYFKLDLAMIKTMGCRSIIGGSGLKIMARLCYQLYLGQHCKHDRPRLNYYELYRTWFGGPLCLSINNNLCFRWKKFEKPFNGPWF